MKTSEKELNYYGKEKISKILLQIAPPIMLSYLIQALYNVVDSFFLGKYSGAALNALTVVYPLQLIIIAFAVGTGVGVNTVMAKRYAEGNESLAAKTAGSGFMLSVISWAVFACFSVAILKPFCKFFVTDNQAYNDAVNYGYIVCVGSVFSFLEGNFTKVLQAKGKMTLPMIAQFCGALTNIILDPVLIFGVGFIPASGAKGAAIATVIGQAVAAIIVGVKGLRLPPRFKDFKACAKDIYKFGYSSIFMQSLYTVYILGLNAVLTKFSDDAITVLGLYYKLQTFFFIPLFGFEACIVPVLSYNYTQKSYGRCKETMNSAFIVSGAFMLLATVCFVFIPVPMLKIFSHSESVLNIGKVAFPIIGSSFLPATVSLMSPVFFQAIGEGKKSAFLSLLRQIICLMTLFYLFSLIGLNYTWIAFPAAEVISGGVGLVMYLKTLKKWKRAETNAETNAETAA